MSSSSGVPAASSSGGSASGSSGGNVSGVSRLSNSVINLLAVRQAASKELIDAIAGMSGRKALVADPELLGILDHIADVNLLRDNGVDLFLTLNAMLPEGTDEEFRDIRHTIFLVRPRMELMRDIGAHVSTHISKKGNDRTFWVLFVPRRTLVCERILEEEGVYGNVEIRELNIHFLPIDDDILSMELADSFKECFLEGDTTSLYYVAKGLLSLEYMFGTIPNIRGKGFCSENIIHLMSRMRNELPQDVFSAAPEIDTLFLVDRTVDMATPMITQLTYEGLLDEIFGIDHGFLETDLDVPISQPDPSGANRAQTVMVTKHQKIALNGNDRVFNEIRNRNFVAVGSVLNSKALAINETYESRRNITSTSEIREFMKSLPVLQEEHRALGFHIQLAQRINEFTKTKDFRFNLTVEQDIIMGENEKGVQDYIEDLINKQDSLSRVLRLLSLWSVVNNGLKPKIYDFFRKELVQTYGYELILTLHNLERIGLLKRQEQKSKFWNNIRKSLRLIVEDRDDEHPRDISYVCSGYAPMTIRLLESTFVGPGFSSLSEILNTLPGPTIETRQRLNPSIVKEGQATSSSNSGRKVVLVVFVGGITFAEINALRFLSRQDECNVDFIVATTKIITGRSLIRSLYEDVGLISTRG